MREAPESSRPGVEPVDEEIAAALKSAGLVDDGALARARVELANSGGTLQDALLRQRALSEPAFLRHFAGALGSRFVRAARLAELKVDDLLLEKLPAPDAERLRAAGFRYDSARDEFHAVFAAPMHAGLAAELKRVTGARSVQLYLATHGAVDALIRRWHFRDPGAFNEVAENGAAPVRRVPASPRAEREERTVIHAVAPPSEMGGATRTVVTVLFAELRGFGAHSANLPADQVARDLNAHFARVTETVEAHGGTVARFIGDAVVALFGAPRASPDDARNALRAALAMQECAASAAGLPLGIGLDTGEVVLGLFGSSGRLEHGAVGSAVQVAARLCGVAQGGDVLTLTQTLEAAGPGVKSTPTAAAVALPGFEAPVVPYRVEALDAPG